MTPVVGRTLFDNCPPRLDEFRFEIPNPFPAMAPKVASPTTYKFDLLGTSDKEPIITEFA